MAKKFPWLSARKKTDPELPLKPPLWFGNQSNGEYFRPATERHRKIERLVLQRADDNARRLGMDRREFLASAMGMCTTLLVLNEVACSSSVESGGRGGRDGGSGSGGRGARDGGSGSGGREIDAGSGGSGGGAPSPPEAGMGGADSGPGARLCAMPETQFDDSLACEVLGGDEFIFDVQTHWFDAESAQPAYVSLFRSLFDNGTEDHYVRLIFCESDTHVTAITSWPGNPCGPGIDPNDCGLPLSNEQTAASRDRMNQRALNTRRSVNHVQVMGQSALGIESELDMMERMCEQGGTAAWKLYPGFLNGFRLDDGATGRRIIEKGIDLGVNQFCVHKGLQLVGFNVETNYPDDIGNVAADYPEANFVIYHAAINAGYATNDAPNEGPYDPGPGSIGRPYGVNALIKALADRGIGPEPGQTPNRNVYGEIGSAINHIWMDGPDVVAHFFGKLMKYLGPDYVLWGTDCVIYGSPQPFIEWFRTVEIPESMAVQFGYPRLDNFTAEGRMNKAKIFGLNAARLYGINVNETRCHLTNCPTALLKQRLDEEMGTRRWVFDEPYGPKTYADYLRNAKRMAALGRPG